MSNAPRIVVLPGDGIGPEIVAAAQELLGVFGAFDFDERLIGGISIDAHGTALTDEVLDACRSADAVLLGAVGGPKWDTTDPDAPRPEQGLLGLRKGMGLYANLRPVRPSPALVSSSPLREERIAGTDLLVVRELTGGIYYGKPKEQRRVDGVDEAVDTMIYRAPEIERIARVAFALARARRKRLTSVDKQNILETSRLWRRVVNEVAREYEDVALDHLLVDNASMQLVRRPGDFDVILTENMFGDILSDEAAILTGSIGTLPSASLGTRGMPDAPFGLYEPIGGTAPDIAGTGRANPTGAILSAAMLLRHTLGDPASARRIEDAVEAAYRDGLRTADVAAAGVSALSTQDFTQAVIDRL